MIQVRFAGLGGQGIILMGEILGEAAVMEKKFVGQTSTYGSEARGSACKADVVISDSWIDYPEVTAADVLVCMSQGAYEQHKTKVNPSTGVIFFDSSLVKPDPSCPLQHIAVPATGKALEELGSQMVANMILLGAVVRALALVKEESLRQVVSRRIPQSFLQGNMKALALGIDWGKKGCA